MHFEYDATARHHRKPIFRSSDPQYPLAELVRLLEFNQFAFRVPPTHVFGRCLRGMAESNASRLDPSPRPRLTRRVVHLT